MKEDVYYRALKIIMIVIGIIDLIVFVLWSVVVSFLLSGKILPSVNLFIMPIIMFLLNIIGIIYLFIYFKKRRDS